MSKQPKVKTIEFNVKIDADQRAMLGQLATDSGLTMSEILRTSISTRFRMRFANEPSCVNGNRCLCPNMHRVQTASPESDSELLEKIESENAA